MSERSRRDFIFELLEREWDRRIDEIHKTKQINPDDVVTICTLTLNREMGEVAKELASVRKDVEIVAKTMATKDDLKENMGMLRWMIGISVTVLGVLVALLTIFV